MARVASISVTHRSPPARIRRRTWRRGLAERRVQAVDDGHLAVRAHACGRRLGGPQVPLTRRTGDRHHRLEVGREEFELAPEVAGGGCEVLRVRRLRAISAKNSSG